MRRTARILFPVLFIVLCLLAVPAKAVERPSFEYEISLADSSGNRIHSKSDLKVGDEITVTLILKRTDSSKSYYATGVEMALLTKGLNAGKNTESPAFVKVSSSNQKVSGTQTLAFRYYDMGGTGVSIPAELTVCSASYLVDDPLTASVLVSARSVYLCTTGYVPTCLPDCDLNGNDSIDLADISLLFRIASGKETCQSLMSNAGDLNEDGDVDLRDVSCLFQLYKGIHT